MDGEKAVIRELNAALVGSAFAGVRVGTKIPMASPKPARFVRVVAAGGDERDVVADEVMLVVDAFSSDEQEARDLAAFTLAVLQRAGRVGALGGETCYGVSTVGMPANNPLDLVPTHFRFTYTVSAGLRRASA